MKKMLSSLLTVLVFSSTVALTTGCGETKNPTLDLVNWDYSESMVDDKYRNFYEIYVQSFCDSDEDKKGDLYGVGQKMEYIHDLGFNGIWLMPIHPSISYHKYDVDDYYAIDKDYGTMESFEYMMEEAEKYDIAVVMDLVINHSSANHQWFRSAVEGLKKYAAGDDNKPSSECLAEYPTAGYYNFVYGKKPTEGVYRQVSGTSWWYESWFSDNMPDLNLNNEGLKAEIVNIMKFWLEKGVKGFRLDAALHFFGSSATAKNVEFLRWLEKEAQKIYEDVYFVAEVWQGKIEQNYYASGIDSFFNFSNSQGNGTVISSIIGENASKFVDEVVTYQDGAKTYDKDAIVANFLGNHDMQRSANALVKEILVDDGKETGLPIYNNIIYEDYVKMSLGLNQMISGTSWVYYGEEIGMLGHNNKSDPNYRTAMLWSEDEFDLCDNPQGSLTRDLIYDERTGYGPGTVDQQLENPNSILNYVKIANRLRHKYPAIARGNQKAIKFDNYCPYAILEKEYNNEKLYILINISEEVSEVTLEEQLSQLTIQDTLSTSGKASTMRKGVVKAAPYSITILK